MPKALETLFTKYSFTPEEMVQASIFTTIQKQLLQTKIAELAEEKALLKFDPKEFQTFLQREAELQGQINSLQWILNSSQEAEAIELAKNAPRSPIPLNPSAF
jgi:translation initiation factor 2 beta subunit (eIF-2beta)/eIF-5